MCLFVGLFGKFLIKMCGHLQGSFGKFPMTEFINRIGLLRQLTQFISEIAHIKCDQLHFFLQDRLHFLICVI